jgi:hypothetical protein
MLQIGYGKRHDARMPDLRKIALGLVHDFWTLAKD